MRITYLLFLFTTVATPVLAQTSPNLGIVCDPNCHQGSTSTARSSATSQANTRSNSVSTGNIAGTQVNSPITTRATGGNSRSISQGGSSQVLVVNKVSGSGGYRGTTASNTATDPPATTDPGPALGSANNPLTENIGGTTTIRNVPEIVAPNISGGNPCLVGISGGGAGPGIGITLGFGYSDKGCERRNSAALLNNIGEKQAAIELMCDDDKVREAMARAGQPCEVDRVRVQQPVANIDPAVIRHEQAAVATPVVIAKPVRPDWCATASKEELRSHPQCDQ